jgi:transcriptional regulator with XRE-family HTH domain
MSQRREISSLLRMAREAQRLDLRTLSRRSGIHQSHLLAIEEGRSSSFHNVYYCKVAVMAYAKAVTRRDQVAALWNDEDWKQDAWSEGSDVYGIRQGQGVDLAIIRTPTHYFVTFSVVVMLVLLINNLRF